MNRNTFLSLLSTPHSLLDVSAARHFLEALDSSLILMQLYQELFPTDFQIALSQGLSLFPLDAHSYSSCEIQFFERVDRLLFPLPLCCWLDGDPFGERRIAYTIPVIPSGFDFEAEDTYADLSFGWQLLLYLMGVLDEEFLREHGMYEDDALYDIPIEWRSVSKTLLTLRCEAQGGPIVFLHQALKMLRNDTASIFLNVTEHEPYLTACWSREDVEMLHAHYLLAQDIRDQAESFCEWVEENPLPHFATVVRLWNACVRDTATSDTEPLLLPFFV